MIDTALLLDRAKNEVIPFLITYKRPVEPIFGYSKEELNEINIKQIQLQEYLD